MTIVFFNLMTVDTVISGLTRAKYSDVLVGVSTS